jgi:PadR family transcriptional regulator PadR
MHDDIVGLGADRSSREFLGEFEQLVLLAVMRLDQKAYGVPIRLEIEQQAERSVSRGAVYVTLDRLARKGFVRSRQGDPTPERGGRPRRYYAVTDAGLEALAVSRRVLLRMWQGLEPQLGSI